MSRTRQAPEKTAAPGSDPFSFPKAWRAKPAMSLQAPRVVRAPCAHVRPAPVQPSLCVFVVLRALCGYRAASGLIAARGGGPGFNLCGSPSFQASKLLSFHCASCVRQHAPNLPKSAKSTFPPHWQASCTFVVLRVLCECRAASGFIAASGAARASTSGLLQASKPPNFQASERPFWGARLAGWGIVRGM